MARRLHILGSYWGFSDLFAVQKRICVFGLQAIRQGIRTVDNGTVKGIGTGEYKKIEPDCREGVRVQLERMKELCKERNNLYEKQNDLKGQKQKIEKSLER